MTVKGGRVPRAGGEPVSVAHVADQTRHYPGETVTYYTKVMANADLPQGFMLRVSLPDGLDVAEFDDPTAEASRVPTLLVTDDARYITWQVRRKVPAGEAFEYVFEAAVQQRGYSNGNVLKPYRAFETVAEVLAPLAGGQRASDGERVTVLVYDKSRYLRYLPAIYAEDDLMGRFLMLFESFWGASERQIANMDVYFDPDLTPEEMLPWLAGWLNLVLDERWPQERRRLLVRHGAELYRARGTRAGLERYLELFTGVKPTIVEHRAKNMALGSSARMGPGIALGKNNRPHTFSVHLALTPIKASDKAETERLIDVQEQIIREIIESEKPAHTAYSLTIERSAD